MKLMDLLAAGVTVVAEAVGQIKEYIQHNESGMLVAPRDVDGFVYSVLELLNDKENRAFGFLCSVDHNGTRIQLGNLGGTGGEGV